MRLTNQNLINHTNAHSKFNFNNLQTYLNSQQDFKTNQKTNTEQDLIPKEIQTRDKNTQDTKKNEIMINPHDASKATKPSAYIFDNWSSSDSIPLKARVPKSNESLTNDKVENQTSKTENDKDKGKEKEKENRKRHENIKVIIETTKPKSKRKRKREQEEMNSKETEDSIVNRDKILNERKETRRKKAAIVQDQSIPIHNKLKREAKSKLDPEIKNQTRRSTTLNTAIEGLESIPKSKIIKHQGRITIGRSNTFGIFQRNVSSSILKPTPRKGSGDLVFNELKFLDKKKHVRSNEKSQSPTTDKNLDKSHDQISGSESDEVNPQKDDKTKKTRKDLGSNSSVRELCVQGDVRKSISSHSDTDHQHSANSLRLRPSVRLTISPSVKQNSSKRARENHDKHKQPSLIRSQNDPKSQESPEISIHEETSLEEPFASPRQTFARDSNLKSRSEGPLRSTSVDQMSNNTQTNNSLDRLIMACEADMPMILYDHDEHTISCHSHGSRVDCYPSLLSGEMKEVVNDSRFMRPSSLQDQEEIFDDDEAHYTETELAEGMFLDDQVEYGYEEDFMYSQEIDEGFKVEKYGSRVDHHSHDSLECVDHRIRTSPRSNPPQALKYLGSHRKDVFDPAVVGEELDIDLYGSGPSRYVHHQPDYLDYPVEDLEDFSSFFLLSEPDHQDSYENLPERDHKFRRYESDQDMIDHTEFNFDSRPYEKDLEMGETGLMMKNERLTFGNRNEFEGSWKRMKLNDDDDDRYRFNSRSALEGAPPGFEWTACRA